MRQAVVKLKVLFIMREIHVWCNQGNDAIRMRTSLKDNAINGISEYRNICNEKVVTDMQQQRIHKDERLNVKDSAHQKKSQATNTYRLTRKHTSKI